MIKPVIIGAVAVPGFLMGLAFIAHHTDEVVFPLGILAAAGAMLGVFFYVITHLDELF